MEQQFLTASKQAEENERQRELEQARALAEAERRRTEEEQRRAEAERLRAEEQVQANARLRQRAIWLAVAGAVALMLAIVAVVFGLQANRNAAEAERQANIAFSRQLAAQSLSQLADRPDLALLLSVEANRVTDTTTFETRSNLLTSLQDRPELLTFLRGHTDVVNSVAFSPDSQTLATGSGDGSVILWDVSFDSWQARACHIANRNMTEAEWRRFMGERPYRKTCPELP